MLVLCSWCGAVVREKPPLEDRRVSHGICPDCRDRFEEEELVGSGEHEHLVPEG